MAYQKSDLVSRVQARVKDTGYSASEITDYLNDEQRDICTEYRIPEMRTSQTYTVTAGDPDITHGSGVPADFDEAIDLIDTTTGQEQVIQYITVDDLEDLYPDAADTTLHPNGQPLYWFWDGATPKLFPAPGGAYTIRLRYWKQPTDLVNDSDVPSLPKRFQEALIEGAAYRTFQAKDMYDMAAIHQNQREALVLKAVVRGAVRQTGSVTVMPVNRARRLNPSTTRWR